MTTSFFIIIAMVFVVNLGFIAWAITDIMHRDNVKYLPKIGWILIIAFILFGSLLYLLLGRGKESRPA